MRLTAKVIIINNTRATDKVFSYLVPCECENIAVGSRVIVPFGAGNRTFEGYVYDLKETDKTDGLKQIKEVLERLFDESTIEVIDFLRKKTFCTYSEAAHLCLPPGFGAKIERLFSAEPDFDISLLTEEEKEVLSVFSKKPMSKEWFFESFGDKKNIFNSLLKKGAICSVEKIKQKVSERSVKVLRLKDKAEASEAAAELSRKAKKQSEILFYLLANKGEGTLAEVLSKTASTSQAAKALEEKGLIEVFYKRVLRTETKENTATADEITLTDEQSEVYNKVSSSSGFRKFLLHGVTGSGKTEVYIKLIEKCLKENKTAIMLVPEISLTPMMTKRFTKFFGKNVAILHSRLSKGERFDEWERIKKGEAKIVLGARSAIFAPLKNIGIIIIDEEHELSYKSESSPRYHARDIAFFRAEQNGAPVLMASATPLVESFYKAETGEYALLKLKERFNKKPLPDVYISDMREELKNGNKTMISNRLADEMLYNKAHNEQIILLLNRRGFSTFVSCRECGFVARCPHCNISLTYHKRGERLTCHYCGYSIKNYTVCPECESRYIRYFGAGTQKLEDEIAERFSDMSVLRMDIDTTTKKNSHEKIFDKFEKAESDILLGTQMVSKGHDFKKVTLTGVLMADASLYIDDYRSSEKTFSLIEQAVGRAGRGDMPGRAVIQTYTPEASVLNHIKNHDYEGFYREEIKLRKLMNYPPFCDISSLLVSGRDEREVSGVILRMHKWLKKVLDKKDATVFEPNKANIGKIKDKYRYRIIIKHKENIEDILKEANDAFLRGGYNKTMTLVTDTNPVNLA